MATTFDPLMKGANVTLSGGNLIATFANATQRAQANRACTGPTYFEIVMTTMPSVGCVGISLAGDGAVASHVGTDNASLGYRSGGTVVQNGATLTTLATFAAGNNIGVAFDPFYQQIWFRVNGGNWNNNVAYAPGVNGGGSGGIALAATGFLVGSFFAEASMAFTTSAVVTAKFSSAGWAYAAPASFVSIDTGATASAATQRAALKTNSALAAVVPPLGASVGIFSPFDCNPNGAKSVAGNVKKLSANAAGVKVIAIDESSGETVGSAITDASGNFTIYTSHFTKVTVIALGDGATYNDLVLGQVVPG